MCALDRTEVGKLSLMYEGDKVRDASNKIRGFLFQDYVAIKCLLQDGVEYVCSEYLEDVDVFFENGTFDFIQAKYYPKTSPDMEEISTDLYYQYLRLQMLQSDLKAVPKLFIHRKPTVKKPTVKDMKGYIGLGDNTPKTVAYPNFADLITWLRTDVYSAKTKAEQKKKLFAAMASEKSLNEFVKQFEISHQSDIIQYKQELMEELAKAYPNPDQDGDKEHWQLILLGLAISYIQRRYMLNDPDFDQLRVDKIVFDQYITESIQTKTERTIVSYLVGSVAEQYEEIIEQNTLSDLQIIMLNEIYRNTIQWIEEISITVDGQYQLLNTLSRNDGSKIARYKSSTIDGRLQSMAECKNDFCVFLRYLWKIMLDICQEKVNNQADIKKHSALLGPTHYIDSLVTGYVCLNFPEDKIARHSVILPPVLDQPRKETRRIVGRIVKMSLKPQKWFFRNSGSMQGKYAYDLNAANIKEHPTVADFEENGFYIECMKCIKTDEGDWNKQDLCGNCIFSEKCVEEGR